MLLHLTVTVLKNCLFLFPQDEILLLAFKECHKVLMECNNQPFHKEPTDYYMCKHILNVHPYKVSQDPVSIHLPISRLLAGMRANIETFSELLVFFFFFVNRNLITLSIVIPRPVCTSVSNRGS